MCLIYAAYCGPGRQESLKTAASPAEPNRGRCGLLLQWPLHGHAVAQPNRVSPAGRCTSVQVLGGVLKSDAKYSKLEQVDLVYGDDQSEKSYNQALALVDKHPDVQLIMAPTSVGIVAAAKAMQDEKLCDKVKVSGLGVPAEMVAYTMNGCAPNFALWSFVDLGYLAYYTAYALASGSLKAEEGAEFKAGRLGDYKITKDPTREKGLRILMGPFSVYTKDNLPQ